jgi:hypothetical protein
MRCGLGESFTMEADSLAMTVRTLGSGSRVPEVLREAAKLGPQRKQKHGLCSP